MAVTDPTAANDTTICIHNWPFQYMSSSGPSLFTMFFLCNIFRYCRQFPRSLIFSFSHPVDGSQYSVVFKGAIGSWPPLAEMFYFLCV